MSLILDASIAGSWALADESIPKATEALQRVQIEGARAPFLLWFEVRNLLVVNERRGRLVESVTARFLDLLSGLPISLDMEFDGEPVLNLARRHNLTVYDAAYLELAGRLPAPLATLDSRLARAAAAEGIALF